MTDGSQRAIVAAFLANLGIAVAKFDRSPGERTRQGRAVVVGLRPPRQGAGTPRRPAGGHRSPVRPRLRPDRVALAEVTGNPRFDAVGSLAIGLLLAVIAVILAMEMKSFLIGEAAAPEQVRRIAGSIEGTDGVRRLVHLRTEHLGPDDLLVVGKITVDRHAGTADTAALIDRAEAAVRAEVPEARLIFLEPDVERDGQ